MSLRIIKQNHVNVPHVYVDKVMPVRNIIIPVIVDVIHQYLNTSNHNRRLNLNNLKNDICRSTPCPHVKQSDEWIDPTVCEVGDSCKYCHTRTEQQFHPEV
jgi:hypothetical protein